MVNFEFYIAIYINATKRSSYSKNSSKITSSRTSKDDLVKKTLWIVDIYTGAFIAIFQKLHLQHYHCYFPPDATLLWNNLYCFKHNRKNYMCVFVCVCCIIIKKFLIINDLNVSDFHHNHLWSLFQCVHL